MTASAREKFEWPAGSLVFSVDELRAVWNPADHPRGSDGKFAGSVTVVDAKHYADDFFNEPDPSVRAADLYSDTMQGMNAVRGVLRNRREGRSPFENADGSDLRDDDDYYYLKREMLPLGKISEPMSGDLIYGPDDLDKEIMNAAKLIEQDVANAPKVTAPLSRGMRIPEQDLPEVGDAFDAGGTSGITSWTTDASRADRYSISGDLWEDGRRVRLVTNGPIAAHDLGAQKRHSRTGDDGEHLIGGSQPVRVVSVTKQGDGPRSVVEIVVEPT